MKNKIIVVTLLFILVVGATIVLISAFNKEPEQEIVVEETKTQEEVFQELKDDVGKGHNGDVVDVEEGTDEKDNKTYTFTLVNGNTQTITIRKAEEGEQIIEYSSDDIIKSFDDEEDNKDDQNDDDRKEDDPGTEDDKPDEPVEEEYGTVYERFINMSGKEQSDFYKSFDSPEAYYEWLEKAEEEYNRLHPQIVIDEGEVIDFGN